MLEKSVEVRLKRLEEVGFAVYKLRTPGKAGVMDRMILWPVYYPMPPAFVEMKKPGKNLRPLQEAVEKNWRRRGVRVYDMCDTVEKVDALVDQLIKNAADALLGYTG